MIESVSLSESTNDTPCFPEGYVIQELVSADAYLANEQLIQVVGG
jgi:hypothetical protein